jgi:mono/diheme cytochrome c family protein
MTFVYPFRNQVWKEKVMKGIFLFAGGLALTAMVAMSQNEASTVESQRALVNQYCSGCHNDSVKSGGFSFTSVDIANPGQNAELAEKVIRKVRSGMMPPAGARRPDEAALKALVSGLESRIDQAAGKQVYVVAPELHRVNRTEYRNSVRDLLGLDVDVTALLPPDPKTGGFDNMSDALTVTPALMQSYIRAAEKISREAVGDISAAPVMESYMVPKVANQYRHVEGTPFGTRGGIAVTHNFPADGDYVFKLQLYYWYTGELVGSKLMQSLQGQEVEISIDGERVSNFKIDPQIQETEGDLDTKPIPVKAGPHRVAAAFISKFDGPVEDQYWLVEQTLMDVSIGTHAGITGLPHLRSMFITGPMKVSGVSDTPSRRKIFTCKPATAKDEEPCATQIISRLTRQAFRRPVNADDLEGLMAQYQEARKGGANFETGIRTTLQAILAKPEFVFRFEPVPTNVAPGQNFRISDLELASRLSYFLWSTAPDETLINLASQNKLRDPVVLQQQVKRMLADPRAESLSTNFAGQWLQLGGLKEVNPESGIFPNFTRNLANSMRREVELLFDSVVREDRNVGDLLTADYTFVDEVLAKHYGIPNVLGSRFQRVTLTDPNRFGLLGKGGILTMTALANRTSPVARGKYVLEVLVGTPPPKPPPNVPKLKEAGDNEKVLSVRERMEQHRANATCSACHQIMDPIGLALENFDAVGLWRTRDGGFVIDPAGKMYDGSKLDGPVSVRQAVVNRSDAFLGSFTQNLLAYGVGRVLDYRDMPTVRSITREAARNNNRFSAFVMGVVKSPLFTMSRNNNTTVQQH